jgi:hypothetical protein
LAALYWQQAAKPREPPEELLARRLQAAPPV